MAAMMKTVEQLAKFRESQPEKYYRICRRLDMIKKDIELQECTTEIEVSQLSSNSAVNMTGGGYDIFEKLINVDKHNSHYWRKIITARAHPHAENDYRDDDDVVTGKQRKKARNFSLMKMLLTADEPVETLTKMCLYNDPDKLIRNLVRHHDPREFSYNVRAKYKLPFPDFLRLKSAQTLDNVKSYKKNKEAMKELDHVSV